jgi:hypothetical protein
MRGGKLKHPLPAIFQQEINRLGQYRTLEEEVISEYESSKLQGLKRATLKLTFTLHPRERGYGGTVSFLQPGTDESFQEVAAPVAQGLWQALASFRLVDFALVIHDLEVTLIGDASELLPDLAGRAARDALHESPFQVHNVPGWTAPEPSIPKPVELHRSGLTGAERRAKRDAEREAARQREASHDATSDPEAMDRERGRARHYEPDAKRGRHSNHSRQHKEQTRHHKKRPSGRKLDKD